MTRRLNPSKPVLGSTYDAAVQLDLDNISFQIARDWSLELLDKFQLEGFILLKSSEKNYHVVFNRTVSWHENIIIVASACLQFNHKGLLKWFLLQCIKNESTLRVSMKGKKPKPRIVYRHGKQDKEINIFLLHRRLIKGIIRRIKSQAGQTRAKQRLKKTKKSDRDEDHEKSEERSG